MERQTPSPKPARGEAAAVLPSDARMSDEHWPGVVCMLGQSHRVAVNHKCNRYALQSLHEHDGRVIWVSTLFASASALRKGAARFGVDASGVDLPNKPADALAEFREAAQAAADAWKATDTRGHGYAWTLDTLHHVDSYQPANPDLFPHSWDWLRLIVTPDPDRVLTLQASAYGSQWLPVVFAESPAKLRALLRRDPVPVLQGASEMFVALGDMGELWFDGLRSGRVAAMVAALPEDLADLDLPDMPERPKPLHASGRPVRRSAGAGRASATRAGRRPKASRKARRR